MSDQRPSTSAPRAPNFLHVLGTVLSSFLGIRKRTAGERDLAIKPQHVIIAAIIVALCFIATLATLVHFIVGK
jgi:hypothetical protein